MQTEIYRTTPKLTNELDSALYEGEHAQLREDLGLPELARKEPNANLCQFRAMTEEEQKVYGFLFPTHTKLEDYTDFIPNDVLEAYKEFKETYPHRIVNTYVWHAKEYDPDPVLVCGVRTIDDEYTFENRKMLIARWGDALLPFDELKLKAFTAWKNQRIENLKKLARALRNSIETTEEATTIGELNVPKAHHID